MMLPAESGTLPHGPWTPMSLVNGRSPQAKRKSVRKRLPLRGSRCVGDSPRKPLRHHREAATAREAAKQHREAAPQRKAKHHRDEQRAEPAASGRATCRTAASRRASCRKAPSGSNSTAQSKAPSGEQPTEPAASGRALFVK